jgi:hypothetical protein
MATVKKTSGNYVVQTPRLNNGSNITLDTDSVIVTGNLHVLGNVTTINTTETNILDKIITLNAGETGNGVTGGGNVSGIAIDRGFSGPSTRNANVDLRWNENYDKWEFTNDGVTYSNIGAATSAIIASNVALAYTGGVIPSPIASTSIIYGDTVDAGRTGVYIVSGDVAGDELVSKKRALGLSLIL